MVARSVYQRLLYHGWEPHQAAGIVGNLQAESGRGLNPRALGDNGTAYGIAQWRGARLQGLIEYASARGTHHDDPIVQADYANHELHTTEKRAGDALRNSRDIREATRAAISFERPRGWTWDNPEGGMHFDRRLANAQSWAGGAGGTEGGQNPASLLPPDPNRVGRSYDGSGSGTSGTTGAKPNLLSFGFGGFNENGTGGFKPQDTPMQINQGQTSSLPSFAQPESPTFEMEGTKPVAPKNDWSKWGDAFAAFGEAAGAFGGGGDEQSRPLQAPTPPVNLPQVSALPEPQRGLLAPRPTRYRNPLSLLG